MNKRFKEYRMFLFCLVLLMIFVGVGVYNFILKQPMRVLGMFILVLVTLFLLMSRFKLILFDDMMMIYEWKYIALMPSVVQYKDIQSMEKISKHHLIIHHLKDSHVYVFNSDLFMKTYQSLVAK